VVLTPNQQRREESADRADTNDSLKALGISSTPHAFKAPNRPRHPRTGGASAAEASLASGTREVLCHPAENEAVALAESHSQAHAADPQGNRPRAVVRVSARDQVLQDGVCLVLHTPVDLLHQRHIGGVRRRGAGGLPARAEVGGVPGGERRLLHHGGCPGMDNRDVADNDVTRRGEQNVAAGANGDTARWGEMSVDWLNRGGHAVAESHPTPSLLEEIVACRGGSRDAGTHESVVWVGARKCGAAFASHWPLHVWVRGQAQSEAGARGEVVVAEREGRARQKWAAKVGALHCLLALTFCFVSSLTTCVYVTNGQACGGGYPGRKFAI
jgi:hypothetical protein